MYSCDESGFPLQTASSLKVCVDRCCKRNFQITSNNEVSITTLQYICANGNALPLSLLFPGVNFNPEYSVGFPDNFYLGCTKSGWIDLEQFYTWMTNHFVTHIPPRRPIVVLSDGHSSHIDLYVIDFCANNGIFLFRLPPHSFHTLQPADRRFFGTFKSNFSKEVAKFSVQHPGVSVTKRTFSGIFTKAFEQTCRADIIKGSFRVSGMWPINRFNIDHNLFNPGEIYTEALQDTQVNESQVTQVLFSAPASTTTCSNIGAQSSLENVEGDSVFGSLPKPTSSACSSHTIEKLPDF